MAFDFPERTIAPRVQLRAIAATDARALYALIDRDRTHLSHWLQFAARTTRPGDTEAFVSAALADMKREAGLTCVIVVDGDVGGVVGLHAVDTANRKAEAGYWLASHAAGRGIMTAAVGAVRDDAFARFALHRLEIIAAAGNVSSRRVAERCGFVLECMQRERIWLRGRAHDAALYVAFAPAR